MAGERRNKNPDPKMVRIMELTFIKDKLEQAQALAKKGKHVIAEDIGELITQCQAEIDDKGDPVELEAAA